MCIRDSYNTVDRAHRDWTPQQIEFLANIVRLWRGEEPEFEQGSREMIDERFADGAYANVAGLCGVATVGDIEEQGWSLNPGRYVGTIISTNDDGDFKERANRLTTEFETLEKDAVRLSAVVKEAIAGAAL